MRMAVIVVCVLVWLVGVRPTVPPVILTWAGLTLEASVGALCSISVSISHTASRC